MADPIILKTRRMLLRPPFMDDAPQIAERVGLKEVAWNLGRVPHPYQVSDAEDWLQDVPSRWEEDTAYVLAMTRRGEGVMGCISLRLMPMDVWEIGYWLGKPWWGQGYATEAATALLDWAERELSISRFASGHFTDNPASGRILTKLGFIRAGETELYGPARGGKYPCVRYGKGIAPDLAVKLAAH